LNNSNFQEKNPQNIENLTSTIFNSQIIYPLNQIYNKDNNKKIDLKKSATSMTVHSLASIPYNECPTAEFSQQPFSNIAGYGLNSYNGKVKKFNEDRTKAIVNYKLNKNFTLNGIQYREPCISYFSIFDGHAGKKCSDFLRQNLDTYLFNSPYFPSNPVKAIFETFKKAENDFYAMAYDAKNNILLDKSGSCALIILIIDNLLYAINLGDSRALFSYNGGSSLFQITRDHKPNDEIERKRIEKVGGKVYYANTITRNGKEIKLKEEDFGKGFSFPYRVFPGKIAVSISI
jgi:protein phosphatase 2C family protein 2/3